MDTITEVVVLEKNLLTSENGDIGEKHQKTTSNAHKFCGDIWLYIHVSVFAMIGCLIRIVLDHVTGGELANVEDSESVVFKSFFSNMLGSFILGVVVTSGLKSKGPLAHFYTGISTGLCGSITTYSKWNQQVSLLLIGESNGVGNSQLIGFTAIIVGIMTFLGSYNTGKDTFVGHRHRNKTKSNQQRSFNNIKWQSITNYVALSTLLILFVMFIIIAYIYKGNSFILVLSVSALLAPVGANSRLLLGKLNGRYPKCLSHKTARKLPLGTLYANFIGSFLIAISHVVVTRVPLTCTALSTIRAIQSGLIACLTTVSTFMSEVSKLRCDGENVFASYVYLGVTISTCQVVACFTNGLNYAILQSDINSSFNNSLTYDEWINSLHEYC